MLTSSWGLRMFLRSVTVFFISMSCMYQAHAGLVTTGPSAYPHTIDGEFTDWPPVAPNTQYEWFDITPTKDIHPTLGLLGFVYDDYQSDGWLYKLNDWTISDGALNVTDDNEFFFKTADGLDFWKLKVKSDPGAKTITCEHNGLACNPNTFHGDYGVVSTPNKAAAHSVWEVSLFIGRATELYEWRLDPVVPGGAMVGTKGEDVVLIDGGGVRVRSVPEPESLMLVGIAIIGISLLKRRNTGSVLG